MTSCSIGYPETPPRAKSTKTPKCHFRQLHPKSSNTVGTYIHLVLKFPMIKSPRHPNFCCWVCRLLPKFWLMGPTSFLNLIRSLKLGIAPPLLPVEVWSQRLLTRSDISHNSTEGTPCSGVTFSPVVKVPTKEMSDQGTNFPYIWSGTGTWTLVSHTVVESPSHWDIWYSGMSHSIFFCWSWSTLYESLNIHSTEKVWEWLNSLVVGPSLCWNDYLIIYTMWRSVNRTDYYSLVVTALAREVDANPCSTLGPGAGRGGI